MEHNDFGRSESWEWPVVFILIGLATLWLVRVYLKIQKIQREGAEKCRKSLESKGKEAS